MKLPTFLKSHPFAVEAFFKSSYVFTFAVPEEKIRHLIPECLTLDVHNNQWAFIAVAMVQTKDLRPKGFPSIFGHDFFLIGYRVFVRYMSKAGKNLRGLYILKSETNKKTMEMAGNTFTHYNYNTTDIHQTTCNGELILSSIKSDFSVRINKTHAENIALPEGSVFRDWKEARRFAGPLPFTFTYNKPKKEVLIIEGVREKWKPEPIEVLSYHFSFLNNLNLQNIVLANAFVIENIPYYWKKGRLEKWND